MEVKVLLVGDTGVGRHKFIQRFICADFEKRHEGDQTIYPQQFVTNFGTNKLNVHVWDGHQDATQSGTTGIPDAFFLNAHAAIIMFDVTSRQSYKNVPLWFREVVRCCDNIPIVLVGNKADAVESRAVKPKMITFHRRKNLHYYDVSAKANYNIEKPFLWLMRRLTNNPGLEIADEPALTPPEVIISEAEKTRMREAVEAIMSVPGPDDDDDF